MLRADKQNDREVEIVFPAGQSVDIVEFVHIGSEPEAVAGR